MTVALIPVGQNGERRYLIRAGGRHAGGITVHSARGDAFSYGIAVARDARRMGVASAALRELFAAMRAQGFTRAVVRVREDNAASLALHAKLGFRETRREDGAVTLERAI